MQPPNLLIILADGLQAQAIDTDLFCRTPNIDRIAKRGVSFRQAHTVCPTCSPARASLMTGVLPHNHGVLEVEHGRDGDQCVLRTDLPHFAQRLVGGGYHTAYFGKWHIERSHELQRFGWIEHRVKGAEHLRGLGRGDAGPTSCELDPALTGYINGPPGYNQILHWAVTDTPLDHRYPGLTVNDAERYLASRQDSQSPWCCCVSFSEPNEALIVGRETWDRIDRHELPLPVNFFDDMSHRPNIYQRQQQIGRDIPEDHWRAARACYFGRVAELDSLVGRLMTAVDAAGHAENTVVLFLSDHGRYVGAHGFEAHNFGAFEEIYRIPLVVSGPGIASNHVCQAQVSIADLCPTICELAGVAPVSVPDSRSLVSLLNLSAHEPEEFQVGYAEYHGTRFPLMQRILWRGNWKLVFNGFDFDELYDLETDPHEMDNRITDPSQRQRIESMMAEIWRRVRDTGDRTVRESHYYSMRFACVGPEIA